MTSRDLGILTTDASFVIRSWNDWLERATGIRASEAVGQPLARLAPGLETRGFMHRLRDALASGTVQVLAPAFHKYLIPCPPRAPSRFFDRMQQHITIGPLTDEGAAPTGVIITIEDVTPQLEQQRELAGGATSAEGVEAMTAALRDDDWRVRRRTVEHLSDADPAVLHVLLEELRRNHRNFGALSSALRLLASTPHDLTAPLSALLKDPDPDLRIQVALALGEQHDPAAAEPLMDALEDPDQNVRFHAIESLGRLRAVSAVDALVSIAESDDFFVAFAALDALALIQDPRVATRLVRLLEKPDVREAVIGLLGAIGDVQVSGPLARVINTAPEAAASAATALTRIHERESVRGARSSQVPPLVAASLDSSGRGHLLATAAGPEQRAALTVLGWLRDDTLAPQFVRFIESEDRDVAIEALVALGETGAEHLLACCHRDESIAPAAVSALGAIGSRRATSTLVDLLDRGGSVGISAAGALARIADGGAFDALVARAGHHDAAVRQAIVGALNSIGHPDLEARAGEMLRSQDPRVRESGVKIAGYFGFAPLVPQLVTLLDDPDETVRIAAIEHLPILTVATADAQLASRLGRETPRARAAIVRSLAHYDTAASGDALLNALEDADLWVRYYAARSLAGRHDERTTAALIRAARGHNPEPVRVAALDALASAPGADADRALIDMCAEQNADVASAALRATGERHTNEAFLVLQEAARGEPGPRASAAFEGLARNGSLRAIEVLQWVAASSRDSACARACIVHLAQLARSGLHGAAAVDALLSVSLVPGRLDAARDALLALPPARIPDVAHGLHHPSVAVRQRAVSVLGQLRDPQATAHLVEALDDDDPGVRVAAISALALIGARNVQPRLRRMSVDDPSPAVRRAATGALSSPEDSN